MCGVSRGVATLVIRVDHKVESHELVKLGVVEAQPSAEVGRVVQVAVGGEDTVELHIAVVEGVSVDESSDSTDLGDQIQGIFESVFPVVVLGGSAGSVGIVELGLGLHVKEGRGELSHGVLALVGEVLDGSHDIIIKVRSLLELFAQAFGLLTGRDLAGEKEPEESFGCGLAFARHAGHRGKLGLYLGNREVSELNTFLSIQMTGIPNHTLDTSSTTNSLRGTIRAKKTKDTKIDGSQQQRKRRKKTTKAKREGRCILIHIYMELHVYIELLYMH